MKFNFMMYNVLVVVVCILVYIFGSDNCNFDINDKLVIGWFCVWNKLILVIINDMLFEFY